MLYFAKLKIESTAMKLSEYCLNNYGSQKKNADACGIAYTYMSHMVTGRRPVPVEYCAVIEAATNGEVSRRDLRPDDWQTIWPELAESA